jgi:hypothetical protein
MNCSILKSRQAKAKEANDANDNSFSWWKSKNKNSSADSSISEHCRLVVLFLEGRIGRVTEDLERHRQRRRERDNFMFINDKNSKSLNALSASASAINTTTESCSDRNNVNGQLALQMENSRLIEEMTRGLFETLSSTESQVLEVSRLQGTLQSHLQAQHDLTCRLFEDSQTTFEETRRGNEYLKRSGKDSSLMRRFLVSLILFMTLLLVLLHYFNK